MSRHTFHCFLFAWIFPITSLAQIAAPPAPQRLVVHSNVLNEDREIWMRMPAAGAEKETKLRCALHDGGSRSNRTAAK
jgi:hypothetical protein